MIAFSIFHWGSVVADDPEIFCMFEFNELASYKLHLIDEPELEFGWDQKPQRVPPMKVQSFEIQNLNSYWKF